MDAKEVGKDDLEEGRWENEAVMYEIEFVEVGDIFESW